MVKYIDTTNSYYPKQKKKKEKGTKKTRKKLRSLFSINDKTNFEHQHYRIYHEYITVLYQHQKTITSVKLHVTYMNPLKRTIEEITRCTYSNTVLRNTMIMWLKNC